MVRKPWLSLLILVGGMAAYGQTDRVFVAGGPMQGPGVVGFHTAFGEESEKVVKGQPFTAEVVTTHVQVLADGNKITNSTKSQLYRDGEGRTRRENTLLLPGQQSKDAPKMIMINDPVAGTRYAFDQNMRLANKMEHRENRVFVQSSTESRHVHKTGGVPGDEDAEKDDEQKEDLGDQTIDGLVAHGTRLSHVIPAGQIGNEKPITVTTEVWTSPELGIDLLRVHKDPWSGEVTTKITNITRGEPDASLFSPPPESKVKPMKEHGEVQYFHKKMDPPPPPPEP